MSLTPSQRIALISGIAERLGAESWSLIDLTLKQFKLPWTDQFSGTNKGYVQEMIEN